MHPVKARTYTFMSLFMLLPFPQKIPPLCCFTCPAPVLCSGELLSVAYEEVLCISHFAVAGIKPHGQGNLEKKGFVWAYISGGIRVQDGSKQVEQDTGGSLLKPQA